MRCHIVIIITVFKWIDMFINDEWMDGWEMIWCWKLETKTITTQMRIIIIWSRVQRCLFSFSVVLVGEHKMNEAFFSLTYIFIVFKRCLLSSHFFFCMKPFDHFICTHRNLLMSYVLCVASYKMKLFQTTNGFSRNESDTAKKRDKDATVFLLDKMKKTFVVEWFFLSVFKL